MQVNEPMMVLSGQSITAWYLLFLHLAGDEPVDFHRRIEPANRPARAACHENFALQNVLTWRYGLRA
jgi:hypothetical protein